MPSYGPFAPGTATFTGADQDWTESDGVTPASVSLINSLNAVYAWAYPWSINAPPTQADNALTDVILATNFGFAIPANETPSRVIIDIYRKADGNGSTITAGSNVRDSSLKLAVAGVATGTSKADTATNWPTSRTQKTYSYLVDGTGWNVALTYSQVNASNFGFAFLATGNGGPIALPLPVGEALAWGAIDYVTMTVETVMSSTWSDPCVVVPGFGMRF